MRSLNNIIQLGFKEIRSLLQDPAMVLLILYSFTMAVYATANRLPDMPYRATVGVVDEDRSPLSLRIINAFQLPYFMKPVPVDLLQLDQGMDTGRFTFTLSIPPEFQRDVLAGHQPAVQLNVDATEITQAFAGARHIERIIRNETGSFLAHYTNADASQAIAAVIRIAYNPNLKESWFGAVNELINQITMLSIILTGAALIREREHGTVEHLLVMPVTPLQILMSKLWSMALVVMLATGLSLLLVVRNWLEVPLQGSAALFMGVTALHLFATTSLGIFYGTVARTMPQLGLLSIITLMPLQMLSGGLTPMESMPLLVREIMQFAPTTHYIHIAKCILFRGAGLEVVWPSLLAIAAIGFFFFLYALRRIQASLG